MAKRKADETEIKALVANEIRMAVAYDSSELSPKRVKAIEYRDGIMTDVPSQPNRSSMVVRTVSDTIDKMLPPIVRTFTASGRIVEYEPGGPEDEQGAQQASDWATHVFFKENDGYRVLYNATYDALLFGNGVVKHYWKPYDDFIEEEYSGLDEMQIAQLTQDPDIEIVGQNQTDETIGMDGQPVALYEIKVRKIKSKGHVCIEAFPPEDLLKNADCTVLEDARFVAHRCEVMRSELIEMGFDRATVERLGEANAPTDSEEKLSRRMDRYGLDNPKDDATTLVTLYECYIKTDINDDGIAETIQAYYAGSDGAGELLSWEEWDGEIPFTDIPCEPIPHQWESQGMAEKLFDLAAVSTVMLRGAIDNQYAHNNPQPVVVEGSVVNKDALVNPKFGQPIVVRKGMDKPLEWRDTPYVGDKIFGMLEYLGQQVVERTGMSGMATALDPETLQNQSATAAQLQHDISTSRAELIARNMAELGWKKVFRKVLKIGIAHQDREKMIRLRGEWVPMDPRSWNADMDCTVNVGLGTGSRDRDMAMLGVMLQSQYALAAAGMQNGQPQVALEMLPKIVGTLVKQGEAAGIRNADDYYIDFNQEKLQQMAEIASQPKEDPKIALEREKVQINAQAKQQEMHLDVQKMQMEGQLNAEKVHAEIELARQKALADIRLARDQFEAEMALKREQLAEELIMQRERWQAELAIKKELGMHGAFVNGAAKIATSGVHVGGEPG